MNQYPRTLDGKHISASMSGFTQYSTDSIEAPSFPAPIIQPSDLIKQLQKLEKTLSLPEIDAALHSLYIHMNDFNNPHKTDLDQFTMEVADVLYKEYLKQGGTGSREYYLQSLFQTLRIANLEEMEHSTDKRLLVSVLGAKRFIAKHDNDPTAHEALFAKLFPGHVITEDPSYALMASVGVSEFDINIFDLPFTTQELDDYDETLYSYIGDDGYLHYCTRIHDLPIHYLNGRAYIPCFGTKVNEIADSNNFNTLVRTDVNIIENSEYAPDKTNTAITVCSESDLEEKEHSLSIPAVFLEMDQTKTFSVFAKMEACRYLAISFKDLTTSVVDVIGIYDLETGLAICINGMNRYSVDMHSLSNGWFRCEFTMFHRIGQKADIKFTFFKEKTEDFSLAFKSYGELCGYLWGMQFERSATASPYIPTTGKPGVRRGLGIRMLLDDDWWTSEKHSFVLKYLQPRVHAENDHRPLLRIVNDDSEPALIMDFDKDSDLVIERYENIHAVSGDETLSLPVTVTQDVLPKVDSGSFVQTTYAFDKTSGMLKRDHETSRDLISPNRWEPGTILYIGCSDKGDSLDGYIHTLLIYPSKLTDMQALFANGEEV